MRSRFVLALASIPLLGCQPDSPLGELACPAGSLPKDGACAFDEPSVVELIRSMGDGPLEKVNATEFRQQFGPSFARNVWVLPVPVEGHALDAVDLYRAIDPEAAGNTLQAPFPIGTVIVHETVDREEGHTVQVKRNDWQDANGRSWWFGKFFDDGTADEVPCTPCEACHTLTMRPGSEGLWGVPREAL